MHLQKTKLERGTICVKSKEMSNRVSTGLGTEVLSGGPLGFEVKPKMVPPLSLPFGNYM